MIDFGIMLVSILYKTPLQNNNYDEMSDFKKINMASVGILTVVKYICTSTKN